MYCDHNGPNPLRLDGLLELMRREGEASSPLSEAVLPEPFTWTKTRDDALGENVRRVLFLRRRSSETSEIQHTKVHTAGFLYLGAQCFVVEEGQYFTASRSQIFGAQDRVDGSEDVEVSRYEDKILTHKVRLAGELRSYRLQTFVHHPLGGRGWVDRWKDKLIPRTIGFKLFGENHYVLDKRDLPSYYREKEFDYSCFSRSAWIPHIYQYKTTWELRGDEYRQREDAGEIDSFRSDVVGKILPALVLLRGTMAGRALQGAVQAIASSGKMNPADIQGIEQSAAYESHLRAGLHQAGFMCRKDS